MGLFDKGYMTAAEMIAQSNQDATNATNTLIKNNMANARSGQDQFNAGVGGALGSILGDFVRDKWGSEDPAITKAREDDSLRAAYQERQAQITAQGGRVQPLPAGAHGAPQQPRTESARLNAYGQQVFDEASSLGNKEDMLRGLQLRKFAGEKAVEEQKALDSVKNIQKLSSGTKLLTKAGASQEQLAAYNTGAIELGDTMKSLEPTKSEWRLMTKEEISNSPNLDSNLAYKRKINGDTQQVGGKGNNTTINNPDAMGAVKSFGEVRNNYTKALQPYRDVIENVDNAIVLGQQALAGSASANNALDTAVARISGESKLSNEDVQRVITAGSFSDRVANGASKFLTGTASGLNTGEKLQVLDAYKRSSLGNLDSRRTALGEQYSPFFPDNQESFDALTREWTYNTPQTSEVDPAIQSEAESYMSRVKGVQ